MLACEFALLQPLYQNRDISDLGYRLIHDQVSKDIDCIRLLLAFHGVDIKRIISGVLHRGFHNWRERERKDELWRCDSNVCSQPCSKEEFLTRL